MLGAEGKREDASQSRRSDLRRLRESGARAFADIRIVGEEGEVDEKDGSHDPTRCERGKVEGG